MDSNTLLYDIKTALVPSEPIEAIAVPLTVFGGLTPAYIVSDIPSTNAGIIAVQVDNKGSSTNIEVNVYGAIGSLGYTTNAIGTMTLNTTKRNDVIFVISNFDKVKVVVTNKDASNATTVDVAIKTLNK